MTRTRRATSTRWTIPGSWLMAALVVTACGGSKPAASPTEAAAPPAPDAAACKALVDRIDRIERDADAADQSDPMRAVDVIHSVREIFAVAAKDLEALDAKDHRLRTLAHDYADYVHERDAQIAAFVPLLETMTTAARKLKASKEAFDVAFKSCGNKSCKGSVAPYNFMLADTSTFIDAQEAMKEHTRNERNMETDANLHARQVAMDERLHAACGRPIPAAKSKH